MISASIQGDWVWPINHNTFLYCYVTVGRSLDNHHIHLVDYTSSNCQPPFWHPLFIFFFFPLFPFLHLLFFRILSVLVLPPLLQCWCNCLLKRINVFPVHHMKIYGSKYVSAHIRSAGALFLKALANCSAEPGQVSLCLQAVNYCHCKEYGLYAIHQCRTGDMSQTMDVPLPPTVLFTTVILWWGVCFDAMAALCHNSQYPTASSFQQQSLQSISWPGKNNLNSLSATFSLCLRILCFMFEAWVWNDNHSACLFSILLITWPDDLHFLRAAEFCPFYSYTITCSLKNEKNNNHKYNTLIKEYIIYQ